MSTQQDIYAAGSENRPPMLNKEDYVSWSSHLLCYAKSKPNEKLLVNSIKNGPYTDDELTKKEVKQMEADDRVIQTILMGIPKDIYAAVDSYPTTAMNMSLILMTKAFKLNYSTPANNNQRTSSNPCNRQIAQPVQNLGVQNVGNQNRLNVVPKIANQNVNQTGNGNVVAARAGVNGNGNNDNQIRCYNCRGLGHYARNCIQASTSGTHTNKAPVYDSDGSAEVHHSENCYDNDIFNMFTQEEQYTELFKPITEPHQVQRNDNNVNSRVFSVEQSRGTVEQQHTTVEELRAYYESLYNNLVTEVEKVNMVNHKMKETNVALTIEFARYKGQEKSFEINKAKFDELETGYRKSVYQEQITTKTRRPQPRSNLKNNRIPSTSKSSCLSNNLKKVEEHHRNLQFSKTLNHTSSEGNNIKLAILNENFEVICATCKQCLITANHDECMFKYVNSMNSSKKNQSANVSESANQNKHKPNVKKSKNLGSKERLASPKPSKPRTCLRWLPTGRIFDLSGTITESSNTESESGTSVCDNASASNPHEPTCKGFPNSTSFLDRFKRLRRQNTCLYPLASTARNLVKDILLNLPDHRTSRWHQVKDQCRERLLASFQDNEHAGRDTRSQDGIRFQDKDLKISKSRMKSRLKTKILRLRQRYQAKDQDPRSQACKRNYKRIPKNTRLQDSRTMAKKEDPSKSGLPDCFCKNILDQKRHSSTLSFCENLKMSAIGLDIGNENCVIATEKRGGIDVLLNYELKRVTPVVVSFGENEWFLGSAGAASAYDNPR
ncbi:retrovirus-related pol polyprotein from transposon TNT 1-94 [Tanacetum coccineum]